MEEGVKVTQIAGLLKRRRPVSGALSLLTPSPASPSPQPSGNAKTLNSTPTSNHNILRSLGEPCLIVGTLNLPALSGDHMSPSSPFHRNCFSFSDDSGSFCCDVLDFDVRMVGMKILVVSWNFIPLKHHGGVLEVIKWKFPADSSEDCFSGRRSVPLVLGSVEHGSDIHKPRHFIYGILESVSPISVVPCTIGGENDSGGGAGNRKSLCGFIVQILACRCKLCCSKDMSETTHDFVRSHDRHSFSKVSFVYFVGSASSWHFAVLKEVGNVISLSRLKKKLIYMGKGEKEMIFVTTDQTCLQVPRLHHISPFLKSSTMVDRSSFGVYTGVVRGMYVQGMVVEVDEDVWLLLTDQLLMPPHSIRTGAVITVRNVHFVNPKFPWGKVLILGACYKTSITVTSFSPLETGCHQTLQSPSLLGKYIGSLAFPARLWVLLIVQCFRKKFAGAFSEKEILGSNHKEGIAQKYASSILSSSVIHPPQIGVFMEFCRHDLCGCSRELSCPTLNLVVPLGTFMSNYEMMWENSLLSIIDANKLAKYLSREHESHVPKIRKIYSSEGSGVSLLGNLKVSPNTGRLQLIDSTHSIDVVVPDLPSSWNSNDIFEVFDYSIVVEGEPGRIFHLQMVDKKAFSCRNIFQCKTSEIDKNLDIYVYFLWRKAISRITPVSSYNSKGNYMELDSGIFHLFLLTHKFPIRPKISGYSLVNNGAGFFAEAMVLPWDMHLVTNNSGNLAMGIPVEKRKRCCLEDGFPNKRCNIECASNFFQTLGSDTHSKYRGLEMRPCNKSHDLFKSVSKVGMNQKSTSTTPVEFPCLVTVRSIQERCTLGPGILFYTKTNMEARSHCLASGRKVLLEFNFETILKYKLLKIGSCYAIKHNGRESFWDFKDINYEQKVVINPDMHLWSLSLFSEEGVLNLEPSHDHSSDYCFTIEDSPENSLQRKLEFHSSTDIYHDGFADVNLWISSEAIHLFNSSIQPLKEVESKPLLLPDEIPSVCQPVESRIALLGLQKCPGTLSSGGPLPEGNFITVCGTVVALHWSESGATSKNQYHLGAGVGHQLRSYQEGRKVICLHLSTGVDIVKIDGVLCKVDCPVGLGPGSNATFHRILVVSGRNHLMLTPVSFITINYVSEFKRGLADQFANFSPAQNLRGSPHTIPMFIHDKINLSENSLRRYCCKVVAVHTVLLSGSCDLHQPPLHQDHLRLTSVSIPIAGFILDDGSLPYCCWTNGEKAAKVLRLHEELPFVPHKRKSYEWQEFKKEELYNDKSLHLKKILDRHQTITVKNYGSLFDSLCQDLQLYGGSDYVINPSDEELLKLIIINACSGPLWSVTGHMMDPTIVKELEKYLKEEQPMLHSMPNIWATEVVEVNLLAEARDIVQSL